MKKTWKRDKFIGLTYQFSILSQTANLRDGITKNWQNIAMFYSVHMQIFIYIFQFLLTSKCIFYYSTTADIFQCDFPVLIKHCFIWLFISILKIRYFGSKKQKYVNTLCHFYQWVLFLVYFVEFDKFYQCFTSELHT